MKVFKFVTTVVAVFVMLSVATTSCLAGEVRYIGGQPDVKLRQDQSTTKPYLDKMPYGSEVTAFDSEDVDGTEWSLVQYNQRYGYVMTKFLIDDDPNEGNLVRPTTVDEAFGSNILQKGNDTPNYRVKNLQKCLIFEGYLADFPGDDGYFGSATKAALEAFQRANRLDITGKAGKMTKDVLWANYEGYLLEHGVMQ